MGPCSAVPEMRALFTGRARRRARAPLLACALIAAVHPLAAQRAGGARESWTLGSPASEVERIEGRPSLVERLGSLGYTTWHFGDDWVRLGYTDARVVGWWNGDGALKVELRAGRDTTRDRSIGAGTTRDDVVRLHGTPTALVSAPDLRLRLLRYGTAVVRVGADDDRVVSWDDPDHLLLAGAPMAGTPRGERAGDPARIRGNPSAPAVLRARVSFADAGGDSVLDGDERATIEVTVRNDGPGTAYGVTLVAAVEGGPARDIDVGQGERADSLLRGQAVTLHAVLAGSAALRDGEAVLRIGLREAFGMDVDPAARLVVRTRAFHPPRLVLDGIALHDQSGNGRIEPREIVDVVARIANGGAGDARDVRASIVAGEGVVLTPESQRAFTLGVLRPGESRDVKFSAYANARARAFPVSVAVREERSRYDTTLSLPLALDQHIASIPELVVRGRDASPAPIPRALAVDVDTGIPRLPPRRDVLAVVLGVERYERAPEAPFAMRDAAVFREYARRVLGVGDDPARLFYATDDEVTGATLRKVFGADGWLARRVTRGTDVIVYFAGHGMSDLRTRAPFLLPNDADPNYPAQTGLALTELYESLAALGARSVTVFVDACFSGVTREGASLLAGSRGVVVSIEHPALRSEAMAVFSAARGDQVAAAWPEQRHGVFTYWLLKGLRGDADEDGDGAILVGELDRYLRVHVPRTAAELDREQVPQAVARNPLRALVTLR